MKKLLLLSIFIFASVVTAQVGINNVEPKATLDVTAANTGSTTAEGIIAPRLTGDQIKAKDAQYLAAQTGALVYATAAVTGTPTGKTINVTSAGYYFFNGTLWIRVASQVSGVDTTDDAWVNDVANTQVKLGTLSNGTTTRPANAQFVALDGGNIGIGTTTPSGKLTVIGGATGKEIGITVSDFDTNNSEKTGYVRTLAYNTANPPMLALAMFSSVSENRLEFGGNSATNSAPTRISFNTDSDNNLTTTGGSVRMTITQPGNVGINNNDPTSKFQVNGSFSLPIRSFSGNVLDTDYTILGTGNVTLPSPVGVTGRIYEFIYDGINFTVSGAFRNKGVNFSSYGIDSRFPGFTVQSNGVRWILITEKY